MESHSASYAAAGVDIQAGYEGVKLMKEHVEKTFGPCDILLNGAGGNSPEAITDKEIYEEGDIDADMKSFFSMTPEGFGNVFSLFLGRFVSLIVLVCHFFSTCHFLIKEHENTF